MFVLGLRPRKSPTQPLDPAPPYTRPVDDAELEALLGDLETERAERKENMATNRDRAAQAICAFANDLPGNGSTGVLFIGATDAGQPAEGFEVTDQLMTGLGSLRSDGQILPIPQMTVEQRTLLGSPMVVVMVEPSPAPPVRYKGRTWIRVGPRRAIASADEERRLSERRIAGDLPFDARPLSSAEVTDLDIDLFKTDYLPSAIAPDVLEENQRTTEEQLASLRFTFGTHPTATGLLVVGRQPTNHLPGAYVQFLRLQGTDLGSPIRDTRELGGPLLGVLPELETILKAHNEVASDAYTDSRETTTPNYPERALREIVRNALIHRDYETSNSPVRISWFDDRIEVLSPGGPYGQVTPENFGVPGVSDYRNPYLAEAAKSLGYVQRFGFGLQIANKDMERNGNPPLETQVTESNVLVTLRGARG